MQREDARPRIPYGDAMSNPTASQPAPPSDLEEYLFDLRGYLVLKNAIASDHLASLNALLDAMPIDENHCWAGHVHAQSYGGTVGTNLQQIYEAGEPFERLIDHPAWIEKVKKFVGGEGTFDYTHGPLFIDENFANMRGPGEAIGMHSGGHTGVKRTQYRFHNGKFACGQINILMALSDIGPGDGATMVVPGSHKSNFNHPQFAQQKMKADELTSLDGVEGAIEVHLHAGDVILFVDAISHGSAIRTNPGQRRICVFRYGPSWGFLRYPYRPSNALLERLTPERRQIVWPHEHRLMPPDGHSMG